MDTEQLSGDKKYKSHKMDSEPISGYIPMLNADTGYYDISRYSIVELLLGFFCTKSGALSKTMCRLYLTGQTK